MFRDYEYNEKDHQTLDNKGYALPYLGTFVNDEHLNYDKKRGFLLYEHMRTPEEKLKELPLVCAMEAISNLGIEEKAQIPFKPFWADGALVDKNIWERDFRKSDEEKNPKYLIWFAIVGHDMEVMMFISESLMVDSDKDSLEREFWRLMYTHEKEDDPKKKTTQK